MHEHLTILGITLVILGYGFFSKLLAKYNISGPMVFTFIGVLLSSLFLGDKPVTFNAEAVQITAEIALIVVLFSDAAALNLNKLKAKWSLPTRLLFVALPITIVLTYFTAQAFFPTEAPLYLLLLALILAPTDAALGKIVVSDKRIPETVRNTINVESGLNDGIVFPVLLTVLALISSNGANGSEGWFGYIVQQISIGAIAGAFVGWTGAKLTQFTIGKSWIEHQYLNLIPVALAILSFYFAEYFHGNGYISAFFAGLFLGNTSRTLRKNVEEFAESEGELLIMISFLVFGLVFVPFMLPYLDLNTWIFALLSLTLLRILPIVLSFGFFKLDIGTRIFIGWFGPRGIASILYILVATHHLGSTEGHEQIFAVASLTILLSIVLHGLSAKPLAILYSKHHKEKSEE
ncbi:Na+/H+ antiporter [hydrothermal vent metagenome]|uniref:Na+/H+ antiporter n=1 Tax=hydrothermal vent metagenome TaxID=652676 RepID=A0A1W1EF45_9ZZZZ